MFLFRRLGTLAFAPLLFGGLGAKWVATLLALLKLFQSLVLQVIQISLIPKKHLHLRLSFGTIILGALFPGMFDPSKPMLRFGLRVLLSLWCHLFVF